MKTWCVTAFAKINLGLHIIGKRTDGFHDLETFFLQIDLADRLFFDGNERGGFEFSCSRPDIPVDASNLCARAHALLGATIHRHLGVRLHLEKNIPVGAGLGGGSSDAAVTLMALNLLYGLNLPDSTLYYLASQVGSDVPFFLTGGLCLGSGRGEIITPLPELPEWGILLVIPAIGVSTGWAYQNYKMGLTNRQKSVKFKSLSISELKNHQLADLCHNDLESVVFEHHPQLADIKSRLQKSGALAASMTGSGSAIFGLFRTMREAQMRQQIFEKDYETYVSRPVRWGIRQVYQDYAVLTSEARSR
ncbi:MAG: 4-(cytidine 5'-diphospho)-2-C-methyl-D-erythritol kinase [candidate division KSB1 bacterium]|nr:4-(cytidine 5'-diphospho)-2-C-methyl-D-erythritol kinase [candidate division KSB1 bacterium]MDZ7302789.1 4-(cytidine 5'-diphospho)-2-C-methyl-D-erythritol kinase [candidate division KSB1 bacterium]MDZ7310046.1 4-(cytidine 5'-diphospho)-2-C-methyl-D-erythritol kinase [candidate division KSB1 bacterium]